MKYLDYPELELLSRALTFESSECKVFTRLEAYSCKAVTKEKRLFKTLESAYLRSASMSPPEHLDETLASPFGRLDQPSARKTLFLLIATLNGAFPDHDFSEVNPADFRKETSPAMVLNSLSTTLFSLRSNSNAPRSYSSLPSSYDQRISGGSSSSSNGDFKFGDNNRSNFNGGGSLGAGASSFSSGSINNNSYGLSPSSIASHPALAAIMDDIMCVSDCEVFTFHPDVDSDPHATADLDEEGLPDEESFDDAYWSDDGDVQMTSIQDDSGGDGTPRQNRYGRDDDDDDTDIPMFDEDFEGGFAAAAASSRNGNSSSEASSEPRTPTTPTSSTSQSKSYFNSKESQVQGNHSPSAKANSFGYENHFINQGFHQNGNSSEEIENYEDEEENEEELDGTGAGLLWATYAFFYNRKLKRILFVSVWSRKNSRDSYSSYHSTSTNTSHHHHHQSIGFGNSSSTSIMSNNQSSSSSNKPNSLNRVLKSSNEISNKTSSPAKRAIERTNSSRSLNGSNNKSRNNRRNRTPSGSPAPSSLSPFPHASPILSRGNLSNQIDLSNQTNPGSTMSSSLGSVVQSFSAPTTTSRSTSTNKSTSSSMRTSNTNSNQNQVKDVNQQQQPQNKRPSSSLDKDNSLAESKKART